jgi:hypothetical protein
MAGVRMTDGNYIDGLFAQGIADIGGKGVGYNDGLTAAYAEAGMSQPGNIHIYNLSYLALKGQGKEAGIKGK